ncbi:hypothetical protein F4808DRAFT_419192 [Astrocystis sublimbata]|nr:hypothetical protein F4808DRAFT_419192 [Astrocystis sublimbata]
MDVVDSENVEYDDTNAVIGVGVAIAALGVITVALRFYVRYSKRAGFKWDDWLILVSLLLAIGTDIVVLYSNIINPGIDVGASLPDPLEVNKPEDILFNQFSFAATVLYFSITSTTKLSILFLYRRLFSVSKRLRRQITVLSILVISYWLGSTIADFLNCIPIKYVWINGKDDPRFCFDLNIFWFATGISEAFLDVLILLLPISVVARLQLSVKKKVATGSVFAVGAFVIASGLLKAVYGFDDSGERVPAFAKTRLWSTVHSGTGIICACLPVCWPVFASLDRFRESAWNRGVQAIRRRYSWGDWSQVKTNSAESKNGFNHDLPPDTDSSGIEKFSLDGAAMEMFEVEFRV